VALIGGDANASITASFTVLGSANGGPVITAPSGWTAFRLTATADSGDVITAVDFSTNGKGIFGTLLQRWVYNSSLHTTQQTPAAIQQNNSVNFNSLDSHFVTLSTQTLVVPPSTPLTEDNNQALGTLPGDNPAVARSGVGTFLQGSYGINTGFLVTQPLAYVLLKDGTVGSATFALAEAPSGGGASTAFNFNIPFFIEPPHPLLITLTPVSAGTPLNHGNKLSPSASPGVDQATFDNGGSADGMIHVLGSNSGYTPGHANNIGGAGSGGQSTFYTEVTGWNPATDLEIFALNVKVNGADPTPAQDSSIVNDINSLNSGNITASLVAGGQYASVFPGYDILLTAANGTTSPEYLAFAFSADTSTPGVTVTDIAIVPEPASLTALLPAAAILLGRRKQRRAPQPRAHL
jgi:hypothetical protein